MTQQSSVKRRARIDAGGPKNVKENWVLYDTILVHTNVDTLAYNDGWFSTYAALGLQNELPFFNVRNRNHGLPYNNQDTRDALSYGFRIWTIGVQWFGPSITEYQNIDLNVPTGESTLSSVTFTNELPKHTSLILTTNQDERLRINSLMTPSGVGNVGGGVSQGDPEGFGLGLPNGATWTNGQGVPILSNKWGFHEPLEIPRRANISVRLQLNDYGKQIAQGLRGPYWHPMRGVAGDGDFYLAKATAGIRVILGGQRLVQQRGQYHA